MPLHMQLAYAHVCKTSCNGWEISPYALELSILGIRQPFRSGKTPFCNHREKETISEMEWNVGLFKIEASYWPWILLSWALSDKTHNPNSLKFFHMMDENVLTTPPIRHPSSLHYFHVMDENIIIKPHATPCLP